MRGFKLDLDGCVPTTNNYARKYLAAINKLHSYKQAYRWTRWTRAMFTATTLVTTTLATANLITRTTNCGHLSRRYTHSSKHMTHGTWMGWAVNANESDVSSLRSICCLLLDGIRNDFSDFVWVLVASSRALTIMSTNVLVVVVLLLHRRRRRPTTATTSVWCCESSRRRRHLLVVGVIVFFSFIVAAAAAVSVVGDRRRRYWVLWTYNACASVATTTTATTTTHKEGLCLGRWQRRRDDAPKRCKER